ncbi:MAG: hypothetical protein KKC37_16955, partial [Proteobacteria bacterium]|nr:hypothetical protein [Pseudomonadota bacterium]
MAKEPESTEPYSDNFSGGSSGWAEIEGSSGIEKGKNTTTTSPGEGRPERPPTIFRTSRLPELGGKPTTIIDLLKYLEPTIDPNAETGLPARRREFAELARRTTQPSSPSGHGAYSPPITTPPGNGGVQKETPIIPFRVDDRIPEAAEVQWTPTFEDPLMSEGLSYGFGGVGEEPDTEVEIINPKLSKKCSPNAMFQQIMHWLECLQDEDHGVSPEKMELLRERILDYGEVFQILLRLPEEDPQVEQILRMKLARIGGG